MNKTLKLKFTGIAVLMIVAFFVLYHFPIKLGLDLQGGTRLILEAQDTPQNKVDQDSVAGVIEVIRNRIDGLGVSEPLIQKKGQRQIVVELPGVKDPDRAINLIGATALLEFVEAEWAPPDVGSLSPDKLAILAGPDAKIGKVMDYDDKGNVIRDTPILLKKTVLTGADLKTAGPGTDQQTGQLYVDIEFTPAGARKFSDVTSRMVGKPLAIVLDGKIISAPNIQEPISGGRAQISGHFSIKEMQDLVIKLKAGALPVPVQVISNKVVGPTLGKDSIHKSIVAGIIGFILVCAFMIGYYRLPGVIASVALIVYLVLFAAILKLMGVTLTLPGIAGFILTMGMAVDANVLIFERIKEELKVMNALIPAIDAGFKRAFITILDTNVTTLISAVVLFWLGSGTIRGFAVTLSVGTLISMFSAISVTRVFLDGLSQFRQQVSLFKVWRT